MTESHSPETAGRPRSHRWWVAGVITLLMLGLYGVVQAQADLERNFKGWASAAIFGLWLTLMFLWFVLLSRFAGWIRLTVAGLGVIGAFAAPKVVKIEGAMDGRGLPRLTWAWAPPAGYGLPPAPAPAAVPSTNAVSAVAAAPAGLPGLLDVPQFFGPRRDGVVTNAGLDPAWDSRAPREVWRQPVGLGWSAFAVVGGRAYTLEQRGDEESVTSYDVATGRLLWAAPEPVRFTDRQGGDGPRSTPTIVGGKLYAYGATGVLRCLEADTGRLVWKRSVLEENQLKNLIWGVSASPLVVEDLVIVTGGLTPHATVLAYRAATGEPVWQAGDDKASYASPVLATFGGRQVVVSMNAGSLTLHDLQRGTVLLRHPWKDDKWPKAAQPLILPGDRIFLSAGYGYGCVMIQVKPGQGDAWSAENLWQGIRMKTQFNSVAVRDGFIYGLDDGMLACIDVTDGQRRWKDGRYGSGQTLMVDDLVLVQIERGPVALVSVTPEGMQERGRIPALSAKTWNHPVLAGRYLLVRNDVEAVCYELPVK